MAFECKHCGACCSVNKSPDATQWDFLGVRFTDIDITRIALHLNISEENFKEIYGVKNNYINLAKIGWCPFLANKMCSINSVKPDYCARWTCNGTQKGIGSF